MVWLTSAPVTARLLLQVDPSSRHTAWVEHELRRGQLMASTKAGEEYVK
jgi:hypothetical protein